MRESSPHRFEYTRALRGCKKRFFYSVVPREEHLFLRVRRYKERQPLHSCERCNGAVDRRRLVHEFLYFQLLRTNVNFFATAMKIGCPAETKVAEGRVGLSPDGALELVLAGHEVFIQKNAGLKSGFTNEQYTESGATLIENMDDVYARVDMIVKVKEPQPLEWPLIRPGQIIFAYFHFSADQALTEAMLRSKAVCLAYETVQVAGRLPLLEPMSEVAGKMSIQCGMHFLETPFGGSGVLLGGVPGVRRGRVLILGGGVVGAAAATVAAGVRADVVVLDNNVDRLKCLESTLPPHVSTRLSSEAALLQELPHCDLLIGAVLLPGGRKAPKLVKREHLKLMKAGSVIVDVAVDQGGCVETTQPTTHENPVHVVDGIIHYGVTNMPGAVAQTSTMALSNATLQYILQIAGAGWQEACRANPALLCGLNVAGGKIFLTGIAEAFNWKLSPAEELREVLHQMVHVPRRSPFQVVQRQHAQQLQRKQLLCARRQKMQQKEEGTDNQRNAIVARSVRTLRGRKGRQRVNHVLARTTPRTQLRSN